MKKEKIAILMKLGGHITGLPGEFFVESNLDPIDIEKITVGKCNMIGIDGSDYCPSETFYRESYFNQKIQSMQKKLDEYKNLDFLFD